MNLSKCVDNILPALPPAKIKKKKKVKEKRREKEKKSLVLSGAGCWLGATERKDLQTQKERGGGDRPQLTREASAGSSQGRCHF